MLESISIKNLAIVESLNIDFNKKMNVITGETGAGKSIIVKAINLIYGIRADISWIRQGANKAEINAVFITSCNKNLNAFLNNQDIEVTQECLLRRIITTDGRSRCYINGVPVSLAIMKEAGYYLMDIHGQNESYLLLQPQRQRSILDNFAQITPEIKELNLIVKEYHSLKNDIQNIKQNKDVLLAKKELLDHQLKELLEAKLEQEEIDNIEQKHKTFSQYGLLLERVSEARLLLDKEQGINSELARLKNIISSATEIDNKLRSVDELIASAQIQTQEALYELSEYLHSVDAQNYNTEQIEKRFSELHFLSRKYKCTIPELLSKQKEIEKKLQEFDSSDKNLDVLIKRQQELKQIYTNKDAIIYKKRKLAAGKLSKMIADIIKDLGMPGSDIKFCFISTNDEVRLNGSKDICIEVKTNAGQSFKPLNKIVSGGELSRLSLALSVVTSQADFLPTFIFDEVDVGISGAVAEVVGRLLRRLSKKYQVICITHLAQVAVQGDAHIKIVKNTKKGAAYTNSKALNEEEKITEISRILGGIEVSENTKIAAKEMLKAAQSNL